MDSKIRIVEMPIDYDRFDAFQYQGRDFWSLDEIKQTIDKDCKIWTIDEYCNKLNNKVYPTEYWVISVNLCKL